MLRFGETSFSYKLFFGISLAIILVNIGIAVAVGFHAVVFQPVFLVLIDVILLFLLGTFHLIASEIGRQSWTRVIKYLFVVMAVAAIVVPCLNVPTSKGFIVVRRGDSHRVVFNASVMVPYLDERQATVEFLEWEKHTTIQRDGVETELEISMEFIPRNNKELVRKLVKEHDGNERKIVKEIKKIVMSRLDTI